MFAKHNDMLDRVPHIPVAPRPEPPERIKTARPPHEIERIMIEDALSALSHTETVRVLAAAIIARFRSDDERQAVADEIGRAVNEARRQALRVGA